MAVPHHVLSKLLVFVANLSYSSSFVKYKCAYFVTLTFDLSTVQVLSVLVHPAYIKYTHS